MARSSVSSKRRRTWNRGYELNILRNYAQATDSDIDLGLHWYAHARAQASTIASRCHSATVVEVVGVIAALSPGLSWGLNVLQAEQLIKAHEDGTELPLVGSYGRANVEKCRRILSHEWPLNVLGGNKVRSFFHNLLFPDGDAIVTIDRHMKAIVVDARSERSGFASGGDNLTAVRPSEYDYISWHYRVIAKRLGLIPSQFQAINWTTWRRVNSGHDSEEVPF